jgi:hypothetical protein
MIPKILQDNLAKLPNDDAEQIWVWFDRCSDAIEQCIAAIAKSHPEVEEKICGQFADEDVARIG